MPPRLPGKRSNELAQRIIAIPDKQRTMLQRRMLAAHERGECTGCNQYGEPLTVDGKELPVTREANGFGAPAEFCDCVAGISFQKRVERQRKEYRQQDIRTRQVYAQRLFGLSSVMPPSMQGKTLETWPTTFEYEGTDTDAHLRACLQRTFVKDLLCDYMENLRFEYLEGSKRGLCLIGASGVGKTGLIRCIEPLLAKQGHYMLSLYVPELLRLMKHSAQAEEMIKVMKMVEVLFLDDLGNPLAAEPVSAEVHSFFACIFDERLKYNRPTLITTNLDEDMLETQFGEYILSRIQGLCHMYIVPGIDLR